jgi:hypothetical protein
VALKSGAEARVEGGNSVVGRRQRGGRAWQGGEEVEGIEGVSGDWVRARGGRGGPYDGGIGSGRMERGARTGARIASTVKHLGL